MDLTFHKSAHTSLEELAFTSISSTDLRHDLSIRESPVVKPRNHRRDYRGI